MCILESICQTSRPCSAHRCNQRTAPRGVSVELELSTCSRSFGSCVQEQSVKRTWVSLLRSGQLTSRPLGPRDQGCVAR